MANNSKRYTREFSYARPIMYQGEAYPSADSMISDEYGNKIKGTIFADTFGNYYTKDRSNNVFPVMPVENLDEITVTAPRKQNALADAFSRYLTMSNDITQVSNLPHREYNTHLKANAERGAREHALWDKENPNLSAWRDAATAVPLAVAATPIVLGAGQGILGTTAGQVARQGIATLMSNPYVAGVNDAISLGFTGKGAYDVTQGKFTPETALDLAGGAGLLYKGIDPLLNSLSKGRRVTRNAREVIPSERDWFAPGIEEVPSVRPVSSSQDLPFPNSSESEIEAAFAPLRQDITDSQVARQTTHWNTVSSRGIDGQGTSNPNYRVIPEDDMFPADTVNAEDVDLFSDDPLGVAASIRSGNPLDNLISNEELQRGAASYNPATRIPFKSRNTKAGEIPYTEEEINALVDENGWLKRGVKFDSDDEVYTGGHGEFFDPQFNPEQDETWILRQHLANTDPNNRFNSAWELKQIMKDNPGDRSGVLIKTHTGDTSMDSTPLAYMMATRFAKRFKPLNGRLERVGSNSYGYNTAFKTGKGINELNARAKILLDANPNYKAKLLKDEKGNMFAYELTDENGTFQIPLNSRQEVLDAMNARLHKFNKHYGTSYKDIEPQKNLNGEYYNPDNPYPWNFGESFDLPNIYGIAYKQGGKIKRRLLTSL